LIEKIVRSAQCLTPIALIGAGGIGKTSTALTVLHDKRIKQRFGYNRRFIRCDEFPATRAHFLRRLSDVIGADAENPEDLAPLRQCLSSKEMIIILDNAESILDPQGKSAQEIYATVDELTRFNNICLCITSRISAIPPDCETLEIPSLSMEAARDTFHRIYKHGERSDPINEILERLDFHPLSVTLLATVAQHNKWDANRLTREWTKQRTGVLQAQNSGSLAATIKLSLASPMFRKLGADARGLLGVVAFLPQGVNEGNIDWLFPTISNVPKIFDTFCTLSLTYRSNGFVTMLAPLRDHLRPKDPKSSPLLNTTKECYFDRLSANVHPDEPDFEESRWITSEDVNVEHLLDVFTSIDINSEEIWDTCVDFMDHLYWHKPRLTVLGPKIKKLRNDHPSKAQCLQDLASAYEMVGNEVERERLLKKSLKLWRKQGDERQIAITLNSLSDASRLIGSCKEGIRQVKEALGIYERLGDVTRQAVCLTGLAFLLNKDENFDGAEAAALRAIDLFPEEGEQFQVSKAHRILGDIYYSKGDTVKAIHHLEVALEVASTLDVDYELFSVHFSLAELFFKEGRVDDAQTHVERAKSYTTNDAYSLGCGMKLQAKFWHDQSMFEKARSEVSRAIDVFEELEAEDNLERCRELLQQIDEKMNNPVVPDESEVDGELLETLPLPACINIPSQGQETE
jgi:tetratricopeptide (TPR) repeat protein